MLTILQLKNYTNAKRLDSLCHNHSSHYYIIICSSTFHEPWKKMKICLELRKKKNNEEAIYMRVWFQYRFSFIVRCWMPVEKSKLMIKNRRYWKYYIILINYPLSSWLCSVMTIDKNEPDDIPADEKNESPNSKEITEKVTNHAIQLNAQTLNKCSTILCRSIAN